jgi:hypothetical protein
MLLVAVVVFDGDVIDFVLMMRMLLVAVVVFDGFCLFDS